MDFDWEMFKILIARADRNGRNEQELKTGEDDRKQLSSLAKVFATRLNDADKATIARLFPSQPA